MIEMADLFLNDDRDRDRDLNFRKDRDRNRDRDFGDRANALVKSYFHMFQNVGIPQGSCVGPRSVNFYK